jgi:hypothetical protein
MYAWGTKFSGDRKQQRKEGNPSLGRLIFLLEDVSVAALRR